MFSSKTLSKFWTKVNKTSSCWLWVGCKNKQGYGQFRVRPKAYLSHRFSWLIHNGAIPDKQYVCHSCDTPACINPDHLFLGSQTDNMQDMFLKGRHYSQRGTNNQPTGKAHHFYYTGHKITRQDAETIRKDSRTNVQIAKEFGVDPSLISKIKHNKIW